MMPRPPRSAGKQFEIVAEMLEPKERERAAHVIASALHMSAAQARRMLGVDRLSEGAGEDDVKVGMPVSRRQSDAPLSQDFGKAKWLAVHAGAGRVEFIRNVGLSGVFAAATLREAGCKDVVALHLGPRAQVHLRAAGMRLWRGTARVPICDVVASLSRGELEPWPSDLVTLGSFRVSRR